MELQETTESTTTKKDRAALGWFALGVVFGVVAAVGVMVIISAARTPSSSAAAVAVQSEAESINPHPFVPKVVARPANTQGNADAPVTIIEFSDFNCGFCKRFHNETLQRVIDDYVKTGKAKFSYKHYPFLAASSPWKAEAAECAAEQGRFWDFHEMLFTSNVNSEDEAAVKKELTDAARKLGLDAQAFTACLNDGKARERVNADLAEGQQLGVTGTPSFLINGKPLVGAQPYEAFKKMIDAELASRPAS